jgi:ABC-type lipoprotein export system ATPase subunit
VITLTQFRNRTFTCEGVSGPALNQCSGDNALRALRISPSQPIAPMFGGLLAFIVIVLCISLVLLTFWKPGGVQHARRVVSDDRVRAEGGKDAAIDLMRSPVDVLARDVRLTHVKRVLPSLAKVETPILSGLDARFPSGEVTVLMGPSGSGKSTFLRMLANRPQKAGLLASFVPAGEITLNGAPISAETRRLCAFVEQEDEYHLPALTVRETLRYAAIIKLPTNVSRKRKMARAEEVLKMLGLGECADNMVGGELLKGISGGEKRRLSLACEMVR